MGCQKRDTMLEYMTFNFADKTKTTLKMCNVTLDVKNKTGTSRYPTYTLLNAEKERKATRCTGMNGEECPYLKHKARSCVTRGLSTWGTAPDCKACNKTGRMEKMFKLTSTLKKAHDKGDKKTFTYYYGPLPDGKTAVDKFAPWGGPLDKSADNAQRSPLDEEVKQGHLYFSGNKGDVDKLLEAFRENFARRIE